MRWLRSLPAGDDFTTYSNAQRNRRPSLFLKAAGKMTPRHRVQPVTSAESQQSLNASSSFMGIPVFLAPCRGSAPKDEFNPALPPQWSKLKIVLYKKTGTFLFCVNSVTCLINPYTYEPYVQGTSILAN